MRQNTLFQGGAEKSAGSPTRPSVGGGRRRETIEDRGDARAEVPERFAANLRQIHSTLDCSIYKMLGTGDLRTATMMRCGCDTALEVDCHCMSRMSVGRGVV